MNFIGRDAFFIVHPLAAAPIGHGNAALASIGMLADAVAMGSAVAGDPYGATPLMHLADGITIASNQHSHGLKSPQPTSATPARKPSEG
ncbi:hypothetical protein FJV76_22920 [Mesorhizobium sp. WSM4303]|uniref:hypothetical protein n=1 Tax=unclassified Mesorhizobium TaxID=325217 RepID=UPI00115CBF65|nr:MULTISPECIES: hypothetical protein [unclassified Mesorhizobium]TRD01205.1 hypothetical protein FJV76_22920 [Mesorhizobium sp. WSM4303]